MSSRNLYDLLARPVTSRQVVLAIGFQLVAIAAGVVYRAAVTGPAGADAPSITFQIEAPAQPAPLARTSAT